MDGNDNEEVGEYYTINNSRSMINNATNNSLKFS